MKDIFNLTKEEEEEIFSLLKPIGHKEGDNLRRAKIVDGELVEVVEDNCLPDD